MSLSVPEAFDAMTYICSADAGLSMAPVSCLDAPQSQEAHHYEVFYRKAICELMHVARCPAEHLAAEGQGVREAHSAGQAGRARQVSGALWPCGEAWKRSAGCSPGCPTLIESHM